MVMEVITTGSSDRFLSGLSVCLLHILYMIYKNILQRRVLWSLQWGRYVCGDSCSLLATGKMQSNVSLGVCVCVCGLCCTPLHRTDWLHFVPVIPSQGSDDESYVSDVSDNISEDNASVTDNVSRQSRSNSLPWWAAAVARFLQYLTWRGDLTKWTHLRACSSVYLSGRGNWPCSVARRQDFHLNFHEIVLLNVRLDHPLCYI